MKQVRVLVVDDSAFIRSVIIEILGEDNEIQVIGEAANGQEAVEKVAALRPHLVTMDINMPVMDGLEAIENIMACHAVPILVVTSASDAETAYAAISKGALEVIPKPDYTDNTNEFIHKIKMLSQIKVISHIRRNSLKNPPPPSKIKNNSFDKIIAIACSTGGPKALSVLLSALPEDFALPVVIAQHIADNFISGLTQWLNSISKLNVKTAQAGERILPGTVYLSPPEHHMEITQTRRVIFQKRRPEDFYFPSANMLLSSVARVYKFNSIGIILTGMGDDGVNGMQAIKDAGGRTIAQDETSSVVFGMPKMAIEKGCVDKILPLHDIYGEISKALKI